MAEDAEKTIRHGALGKDVYLSHTFTNNSKIAPMEKIWGTQNWANKAERKGVTKKKWNTINLTR